MDLRYCVMLHSIFVTSGAHQILNKNIQNIISHIKSENQQVRFWESNVSMDEGIERDNTWGGGGLPTLPCL
jgi:hypothetical protein